MRATGRGGRDRLVPALDLVRKSLEECRHLPRKGLEPRVDGGRRCGEVDVETVADHSKQREEDSQGIGSETRDPLTLGLRVRASPAPLELCGLHHRYTRRAA